jgi:hypothetical protein
VGRIVGKAVSDGFLLDAHFTRSLYKHMLGLKVGFLFSSAAPSQSSSTPLSLALAHLSRYGGHRSRLL